MYAQTDRPDIAFRLWRALQADSPADAPWQPVLRATLPDLAAAAGIPYQPPAAQQPAAPLAGPSAEDIANAAQMSAEDRNAMIRGMVDGLAERLATEGGSAAEWSRLIGALGTLGELDRARAIFDEAQQVFADKDADLTTLRNTARAAGLIE